MRAIILVALGLLAAQSPSQAKPTPHEYCKDQALAAGVLMKARQDGILLHDLMDVLKAEKELTLLLMAEEAYRRPVSPTEAGKKAAIAEFQNLMYATCAKAAKQ